MKNMTIILFIAVAVAVCLFAGCQEQQKTVHGEKISDKQLSKETDSDKLGLLKQLDKKFENPQAHYELGKIYHSEGLWDKAEWEYNKALAFDPVHHDAQAAMVKLLIDRKSETRSEIIADMYISQASVSAKHSLLLGRAFQERMLDDYALGCYRQAVKLAPNSSVINKQIGYYYLLKKDKRNAERYLRRSFEINPRQPEIAGELGRLGVQVQSPRKRKTDTKSLEKILEKKDKSKK
ncbi:MAG: hypothetical protein K8R02_01380 [Anaerohalosphaeraceae bacterium]|nr:hypothetical protein [Anaerohalosphaeraceae bacterium]